jgi:cytochrome c553
MRSTSSTVRVVLITGLLLSLGAGPAPVRAADSPDSDFFEKKIRPLLDTHCAACHMKGKTRGGLSLASRAALLKGGDSGPALVPGQPEKSLLIQAVRYHKDDPKVAVMPPKGKLPDPLIADLTTWVARGAVWPETAFAGGGESLLRSNGQPITARDRSFWSFQPIADPPMPPVKDGAWPRQSLDYFILAQMEGRGLRPVRPADRRTLIRRLSFDLIGLPPTPEEVEAFVNDKSSNAYEKLVDRLLGSPHYGERWARHWLDVARYGEDQAHTFQARLYPHGWRYRDWVVQAFNDDLPYDQFIVAQIAADVLDTPDKVKHLPALGFFATGPVYYMDAGEKKAAEAAELDDRLDTLCRGFLGLTAACARCHDHKFDPIPQADYYSLAGVFHSSEYQLAVLAPPAEAARYQASQTRIRDQEAKIKSYLDEETTRLLEALADQLPQQALAAWKYFSSRQGNPGVKVDVLTRDAGLSAQALDRLAQTLFGKGSEGRATLMNWRKAVAGLDPKDPQAVKKVEDAAVELRSNVKDLLRKRDEALRQGKKPERLVADRLREVFGPQGFYTVAPNQAEKQLPAESKKKLADLRNELERVKKEAPPAPPLAHALTEGKASDMRIYLRGNVRQEGDVAPRHFLTILAGDHPPPFTQGSGRLELARTIASKDNPLTARVMVNRIWMHHFGKGIVGTPSNFGSLGERPTHPELLDHLARKFMAGGWSIKALHREIVLSAAYQLDSVPDEAGLRLDPANRLYSRMDRGKLDVEAWRDSLLAASGNLDLTMGGPSSNLNASNNRRRTLYGAISRHDLSGLLRLFDFPDPNLTSEKRTCTTVPLQQLFVLNSDFMIDQARALARKLATDAPTDEARIRLAFLRLYGRQARDWEVKLGTEFLSAPAPGASLTRWEEYAQVLLGVNEFLFVD